MSFQTRSGRQIGRGPQQTQVTYHQAPRQQFVPQQSYGGVNASQPAPPGASTPPQQAQPQVQPQSQPQSQQQVQQQVQQQPQQFKMQQPLNQVKVEAQSPVTGTSTLQGSAVQPGQASATLPQAASTEESNDLSEQEGVDTGARPWKKPKPSFKVNKVLKRRRQNARFRKLLIPKNAIMVLNELQPGIQFDAEEQTNPFNQLSYVVRIEIDGVTYTGEGPSKAAAKAAAAELAVKGLILKKISEAGVKKDALGAEEEPMDTTSGDDMSEKGSTNGRRVIPEDEVPWGSLASFALFKLFADWKQQGSNIPAVGIPPILKPIPKATPSKAPTKGSIPDNPESLHPVTLVGRVYPGTLFVELSREGNPPNLTFCIGATVNGVQYTGTAQNKKEAKKNCALSILKAMNIPHGSA